MGVADISKILRCELITRCIDKHIGGVLKILRVLSISSMTTTCLDSTCYFQHVRSKIDHTTSMSLRVATLVVVMNVRFTSHSRHNFVSTLQEHDDIVGGVKVNINVLTSMTLTRS